MPEVFEIREHSPRPVRNGSFTVRTSSVEDVQIAKLAEVMGMPRADVVRAALQHFLHHHPKGRAALAELESASGKAAGPQPLPGPEPKARAESRTKAVRRKRS